MKPSKRREYGLKRRVLMNTEKEVTEILLAAGCCEEEIKRIVSSIQKGDLKNTEKLIAKCRRRQLDRLHDSQVCIDRLDYLSYQLEKAQGVL